MRMAPVSAGREFEQDPYPGSEFLATAARHCLDELDAESVTRQIDAALAQLGVMDDLPTDAISRGQRVLAAMHDEP